MSHENSGSPSPLEESILTNPSGVDGNTVPSYLGQLLWAGKGGLKVENVSTRTVRFDSRNLEENLKGLFVGIEGL